MKIYISAPDRYSFDEAKKYLEGRKCEIVNEFITADASDKKKWLDALSERLNKLKTAEGIFFSDMSYHPITSIESTVAGELGISTFYPHLLPPVEEPEAPVKEDKGKASTK